MSEYTAEDFAKANLATRGEYMVARRCGEGRVPWVIPLHNRPSLHVSDANMVLHGWVPVVEIEDWKQRIDDLRATHDDVKSSLKDTADDLRARVDEREATIRDLRHDLALARDELRTIVDGLHAEIREMAARPLTLDDLVDAWEAAEVPTDGAPIRSGDVVIEKISAGAYAVMSPPPTCGLVGREFRVLSRAPREPWQDLADSLEAEVQWIDRFNAVDAAQALHAAGWRKTGGDEK